MGKATYQLNKPFPFMKKGYSDSLSLVMAFLEHWDVAISVFRRGDMQSFWTEYVSNGEKEAADFFASAYNAIWKDAEKEDVLFQKVIHYIEPNLEGMPLIPAGEKTARLYNFKEVADWLEESFESKDTLIIPQKEPDIFNAESYNLRWLDAAMKEGVFSAYMPALKEIESSFIQKDDKAKVFLGRKLVAELIGIPYFTYEGHIYTSPTELIKKNTDDKDTARLFRFLGDVFSSKSCVAELEKWSKATLKKENQTDKRLVECWEPLDKEMKSAKGAKWYESYRFPKKESVIFSTSLHLSEYECNQEKKEACVREQIKYLQRQIESAKKEKALIDTQRGFLALLASDHLYDEEQWKELEQIIASYDKRVKEGEKYLKAAESILPVVVNQEYVEHIEQVEEGTARRYLSKLAIWPTETMSEDYREEFFAKFEKMLLEQAQKEVADKELFADADSVRLALCHLVGGLEKNADTDTRRVQGVPILDYYTRKLDTFAGVCEKAGVGKPWYSLYKPVDLCNRYGKRLADKVSGERHELQKKAESLDAAHSVKNSVLEFGGSTPGKGDHHYGAYNKWKTLRDTYKDAIKMYQESDSKLAADIKHELEHVLPEGEAPLGEIVKSKDEAYERVKKLLSERKQNYEKYTEKLTDYKKRSTELKAELNNAWTKEQEKRKK